MIGYGNSYFISTILDSGGGVSGIPVNTVAPVISGGTSLGSVLSSTTGTWTGDPTITYAYQWKRNGNNIGGATNSTYTITIFDTGANITCTITATNGVGSTQATSNTINVQAFSAPVNTVAPAISGTAQEGQTLSCSTGTWTGNPTPTYTYQWYRGASAIGSATNSTYTLVTADVGQNIKCTVTGTNGIGSSNADSNTVVPVAYNQYSLLFDGVDEYAKGSTTFSELDGTNKFTLSMWVKPTNLTVGRVLFHIPRNTTANNSQVYVFINTSGQLDISIETTGRFVRSTTSAITAGVWQHVLICCDLSQATQANRIRPFVNGVDKYSIVNSLPTSFPVSSGTIWVGEEANGHQSPVLGNIDEVAIWGTDQRANVAAIYNSGDPFDLSTLAAPPTHWWRMGDGDSWSGSQWLLDDKIGSYDLGSINMENGDRVTDVP